MKTIKTIKDFENDEADTFRGMVKSHILLGSFLIIISYLLFYGLSFSIAIGTNSYLMTIDIVLFGLNCYNFITVIKTLINNLKNLKRWNQGIMVSKQLAMEKDL